MGWPTQRIMVIPIPLPDSFRSVNYVNLNEYILGTNLFFDRGHPIV